MASTIFIHKEAGQRKDAVRVRSYNDIPEFLKSAISVTTEGIELDCVEGREVQLSAMKSLKRLRVAGTAG